MDEVVLYVVLLFFLTVAIITAIITAIIHKYSIVIIIKTAVEIVKISPLIVGILSFVVLINIIIEYPAGYCNKEHRFLNDEEFIESALLESKELKITDKKIAQTFYANNRNCCAVYRTKVSKKNKKTVANLEDREWHKDDVLIRIVYRINDDLFEMYKNNEQQYIGKTKYPYYIEEVTSNSCGKINMALSKRFTKNINQFEYLSYLQQIKTGE